MWVLREASPEWGSDHTRSQGHGRRSRAKRWEPGTRTVQSSRSLWGTWEVDHASRLVVFVFVSLSAPVNELWITQVKHLSWTQQLSPSLTVLLSAVPHWADFPGGRTPRFPFWMMFAPCIKAKMSSHFLKKPNHPYKNYLYKPKVSFSRECC